MKRSIGLIMGLIALGLLIPGILLVFSNTAGWNLAAVLLAVFVVAAAVFSVLAAVFSILGHKKASAMFICAGIAGVLGLALTLFLAFSFDLTVITTALSIIILFVAARVVSAGRE
jgi:hypothetical protein